MSPELPDWVRCALSEARFGPYLRAAGGSVDRAIQLYWWNVEVSEAFYPSLHVIEVGLRNVLHERLGRAYGHDDWWTQAPLSKHGLRKVDDAIVKCLDRTGGLCGPNDVVAELSFGFWVSLLSRGYDQSFWVPILHRAFPGYRGPRRQLHDWLLSVVLFRNRIAHHEHVHTRDLAADSAKIRRLLSYISPDLVAQLDTVDRVAAVLARRPRPSGPVGPSAPDGSSRP